MLTTPEGYAREQDYQCPLGQITCVVVPGNEIRMILGKEYKNTLTSAWEEAPPKLGRFPEDSDDDGSSTTTSSETDTADSEEDNDQQPGEADERYDIPDEQPDPDDEASSADKHGGHSEISATQFINENHECFLPEMYEGMEQKAARELNIRMHANRDLLPRHIWEELEQLYFDQARARVQHERQEKDHNTCAHL